MADLKGSKTEKNLETAFAGESMARNTAMYRLPIFLRKRQTMRKSMQKCGSSF